MFNLTEWVYKVLGTTKYENEVMWSCDQCKMSSTVTTKYNDYEVGLMAYEDHNRMSPNCYATPQNIRFRKVVGPKKDE